LSFLEEASAVGVGAINSVWRRANKNKAFFSRGTYLSTVQYEEKKYPMPFSTSLVHTLMFLH
jgi:hypothetical protein